MLAFLFASNYKFGVDTKLLGYKECNFAPPLFSGLGFVASSLYNIQSYHFLGRRFEKSAVFYGGRLLYLSEPHSQHFAGNLSSLT